jgi:hypothetical protein
MTGNEIRDVNDELLDIAEQLTAEYADIPAGSVLRCLARSVRVARSWGCPAEHLTATSAATTRWVLAQRGRPQGVPQTRLGSA